MSFFAETTRLWCKFHAVGLDFCIVQESCSFILTRRRQQNNKRIQLLLQGNFVFVSPCLLCRTHGIDGKYITRIMEAAEIPEDAIISSVEPKKYWRMLQAYKNNCSEEFLEKLFVKLGVVTYTVEEEDYGARAVEAEENRRTTFNIGSGLDKSFWHIESGRYKKRDEVSSADGDEYDADALADMDDDR